MKYTMSNDGIRRCTIHLDLRVNRDEYKDLAKKAKRYGYSSVKDMLTSLLLDPEVLASRLTDLEEYDPRR